MYPLAGKYRNFVLQKLASDYSFWQRELETFLYSWNVFVLHFHDRDFFRGICASDTHIQNRIASIIGNLAEGYKALYDCQKKSRTLKKAKKEEFFGLRDFYRCVWIQLYWLTRIQLYCCAPIFRSDWYLFIFHTCPTPVHLLQRH